MGSRTERLEEGRKMIGKLKMSEHQLRKFPVAMLVDDFQKQKKRNSQALFIFSSL